ncbi:Slp family lipoprotein [Rheinheimera sp.]|uniref:Slp family lipoprotein n=1 Tax=Rheinheimera sp. TaxID=1869214 RepID=UPI00307E0D82
MIKQSVTILLSLVVMVGCASYPEQVRIADNVALVNYDTAVQAGTDFGTARWSGVIAQVSNQKDSTRLEVVYFPSGSNGRPQVSDQTQGRFVAYVKGFLDPMVYQQGKSVTVLGELSRKEQGKVDEYEYLYPVIKEAKVYVWPKLQDTRIEYVDPWPYYRPYPYWGLYGPGIRVKTITKQTTTTQGPVHVDNNRNKVQP